MEKSRQVLVEKINFGDASNNLKEDRNYEVVTKNNAIKPVVCSHDDMEKEIKIKQSNYKSFLWKWHQNPKFPLPSAFKMIHIENHSQKLINSEYQWFNFPILSYTCKQLSQVAVKIIASNQFQFYCNKNLIEKFVYQISLGYNIVSYHNFSHGFSLMHMLYQLTKLDPNFKKIFTPEELGFALMAALAHDLGHFGTNNSYQIRMKTNLAQIAKNQAVLQKMHVKKFFDIVKQKDLQIFANCQNPQKMKQLITMNILATDFAEHFKNLDKLKTMRSKLNQEWSNDEDRYFYMNQAIHACDIGNPCLQFQQYINWAALLTYQFNTQTLKQKENNIEVTQMLRYKSSKGFYQGQIGFINNFVFPLWNQLTIHWPGFNCLIENIKTNVKNLQTKSLKQKDDI